MAMPRQLPFQHNGNSFVAHLVVDVPLSTAPCVLCGQSLYPRAFYTTFPPLFLVHADCARENSFFHNLSRAGNRERSLRPGWYNGYYYSGADAYYRHNCYQWYGQQQGHQGSYGHQTSTTGSPSLAQRLGLLAIGAFLQELFKTMIGDIDFGAW